MFGIIKNIIANGMFRVNDLSEKIDTLWAESKLSDDERNQLIQMMTDHINPATEAPELAERIARLEERVSALENAQTEEPEEPSEGISVPAWEPWDGVSDKYQYGAVVTNIGKYWLDTLQNMQNTWEPGSPGVDERYWKEITKEEAEALLGGTAQEDGQ